MPKIEAKKSHSLSRETLDDRIDIVVDRLSGKLEQLGGTFKWRSDKSGVDITGRGFTGAIDIGPTEVKIEIDLSFMLAPFAGTVKDSLQRQLDKYLAAELPPPTSK